MKWFFATALSVPLALLRGLVLSCYWTWFVVSEFPGLPELTYLRAVGLSLTVGLFMIPLQQPKKDDDDGLGVIASQIAWLIFGYPFGLLVGYLWHLVLR